MQFTKNFRRFDRHQFMSLEVRDQIGDILRNELYTDQGVTPAMRRLVTNELNGLYDGYLYKSLLLDAMRLPDPVRTKIIEIWLICNDYPEGETQVF
jgi:hypothetical protein|tara:strand:+ start:4236 stop:4523 length:288 start_codon:yes stop_codon:yes gene_type:complete